MGYLLTHIAYFLAIITGYPLEAATIFCGGILAGTLMVIAVEAFCGE